MPAVSVSSAPAPGSHAPGSTASLRAANQRRVVAALRAAGSRLPVTQADIARTTQLAPATVSNIVRELAGAGLVETTGGSGRRGTEVRISRRAGLVAAVDFGHRHLRVAVGDLAGSMLLEQRLPLDHDHDHTVGLGLAAGTLDHLLETLGAARGDVLGVGLGLPAPVGQDGVVIGSSILPGWIGVHASDVARERLDRPVFVDNDANLCALAEHRLGAGVGHSCMAYIKASSGVGAGLVIDGRLFHGGAGTAGEIGHLTFDETGPICRCGSRGCLEAYTSVGMLQDMLRSQHPDATIGELVDAARAGDLSVRRAFEDVGSHLGWGAAILANLINPSCLVIGGDMAQAGDLLLDAVRDAVRRHALSPVSAAMTVAVSALGERSAIHGALLLALDRTDLALPAAS